VKAVNGTVDASYNHVCFSTFNKSVAKSNKATELKGLLAQMYDTPLLSEKDKKELPKTIEKSGLVTLLERAQARHNEHLIAIITASAGSWNFAMPPEASWSWLGADGNQFEWQVAYHGTGGHSVRPIAMAGLKKGGSGDDDVEYTAHQKLTQRHGMQKQYELIKS
jgi:hypothetical protein